MRLSIISTSLIILSTVFTSVRADDSYDEAMDMFCGGLAVITPEKDQVFTAGATAKVTVTNSDTSGQKNITGLDLYTVENDDPRYIKNVNNDKVVLGSQASLDNVLPSDLKAGYYYYRVWITNVLNGKHGPDCLEMSPTFKVATGSHQNEYGFTTYAEALDDVSIFKPEFALGCFGLKVTSPTEGSTVKQGTHVSIVLNKDSASQTTLLNQVDIYKVKEGTDELVVTIWKGTERIPKVFVLKDQLRIPEEQYDPNASYFYKLDVTGKRKDDKCTFQSGAFKITA